MWDYHVVLVLRPRAVLSENVPSGGETTEDTAWVYDFDSRLPLPCRWTGACGATPPSVQVASPEG